MTDVRFWHLADMGCFTAHVRFRGQSGHDLLRCTCLLLTQSDITNHSTVGSKADIAWDLFQCLPLNSDVIGSHEVAHLP